MHMRHDGAHTRRARRGQHFLVHPGVAEWIVEAAGVGPSDIVLEIGPGKGALTGLLAERAGRVIALEVDRDLAGGLRRRFSAMKGVDIIHMDALRYEYTGLPPGTKIVANLPYYISTLLIRRLLEARDRISLMVLMLQKEVAERIAAPSGSRDYGPLSVFVRLYSDPEIIRVLPASFFSPEPKVSSAVVRFRMLPKPRVDIGDIGMFDRIVRGAFSARRKTVLNALMKPLALPKESVGSLLSRCGIDPTRRPETLSLEELSSLTRYARPSQPSRLPRRGGGVKIASR